MATPSLQRSADPSPSEPAPPIANFIGGRFVAAIGGATLDNVEPATGSVYGTLPDGDAADVDAAVAAAAAAAPAWGRTSPAERSAALLAIADLIDRDREALARAESIDTGKPIALARQVDIPRASANFRFFGTAILHGHTEAHQTDAATLNVTRRDPVGVVGLISPWNLPLYLLTWKIAPALAAGNTAVAKPSEVTPMTAHRLAALCAEAGLPDGVLNIVHGRGPTVGDAIVRHPAVKAISFTGGTATGRAIAGAAGPLLKKVSLELGGKNPNLVFADADLDAAVATSVRAAFANQGQICLCGSRLLVERSIHDEFVEAFIARTRGIVIGDPLDEGTQHGALVSADHLAKVRSFVELATNEGGTIAHGGRPPDHVPPRCAGGYFLEPTVITGLGADCRTNQEEIFGPVVSIIPFEDEAHAIAIANGTRYGLAASVWTRDLDRAHRVADRIEAGTVWVNCWLVRDLRVPFGGVKESGVGREGGDEALRFFTEAKNVCLRINDATNEG